MKVTYLEQKCKSILHKIDRSTLPFKWGVNPYRGCLHSCVYCFARYTHSYLDLDPSQEFETTIFVKVNAAKILRKELSSPKWKKELVNLGSVCDPYQPAEKRYQITRQLLLEFKRFRSPVTVATKSDLIIRDIDVLTELAKETYLNVVFSISSINDQVRQELEPRTPSTERRLKAIKTLQEVGIKVGVLMMPIAPFLNDSPKEIEALFQAISEAKANFVIPGILYLPKMTKPRFFEFIEKEHPELLEKYRGFYQGRSPPRDYKSRIHKQLKYLIKKYQLFDFSPGSMKEGIPEKQSTLDNWLEKNER